MESVVKAVQREEASEEGELNDTHDSQTNSSESRPKKEEEKPRKRHRGSDDERDRRRRRDDYHQVGRRYWDDEDEQDQDARRRPMEERNRRGSQQNDKEELQRKQDEPALKRKPKVDDLITTRTGGAYIPPAKLRMMQAEVTDKNSVAFQRLAWEALKKSIHGLINKVNTSNIKAIISSLIRENLIRGRGLLCRSIIQAQAASPTFTNVYAALVSVINSKFPNIGELLLTRLVVQFKRGFKRNDKQACISSTTFIAHLVNQQVAHEVLALEILTLLLENATDDSVEVSINLLRECGQKLSEVSPRGSTAVFDRLRHVLHEADLDKRVKYAIEVIFQVRKDGFKDNPAVVEDLDLVEETDQFTHLLSIQDDELNTQDMLNVFQHDPNYEENEQKYQAVKTEILGSDESGDDSSGGSDGDEDESEGEDSEAEEKKDGAIVDETETNLVALRRTIYLTVQSSLDHNECAHKMMKMQLKPGQEIELCHMILDCCAQQRTYEKFFGLLAQRFCQINKIYIAPFEQIFRDTYDTIHRLDTNKLRNVGKMFAHLLFTDAISWGVLAHIRVTEDETTSSSRIFLKILFQELAEYMGLPKLNARLSDPTLQTFFEGIFPRDDPRNTRFAINFFTSIGLGGLTDELREFLRTHPKPPPVTAAVTESSGLTAAAAQLLLESSDSDSSSSSSSSSDSSDSSSDSSDSSTSSSDGSKKKRKSKEKKTSTSSKTSKTLRQQEENDQRDRRDDGEAKRKDDDREIRRREEDRSRDAKRRDDDRDRGVEKTKDSRDYKRRDDESETRRRREDWDDDSKKRSDDRDARRDHRDRDRDDDRSGRRREERDRSNKEERDRDSDRRHRRNSNERGRSDRHASERHRK